MSIASAWSALRRKLEHGPPRWLPGMAAAAAAATAIAMGRVDAALLVPLSVLLLALIIMAPPLGHVALVAGAMASPLSVPTGTKTNVHIALLLIPAMFACWLLDALLRRDWAVLRLPAVRAACALAAAAGLAMLIGNLPGIGFDQRASLSAQIGGFGVFALSAAILLMAADQLRDARALQRVMWLYLALGAVLVGGSLMPEMSDLHWWLLAVGAKGSLTWTWFAALTIGQVACNRDLNWRLRLLGVAALTALVWYGLYDGRTWVSGWLPPLVAIAVVTTLALPRLSFAVGLAGAGLALWKLPRLIAEVMVGDNRYSLATRLDAWAIVTKIWAANPLFGLGPSNYYPATPLFPIRGYNVNFSSHSTYVDLLAQTGLLGLACFAWLCWAVGREGWRLRRRAPSGFAYGYVCGALGGLAGTLASAGLGDWVLPFVYNVTLEGMRSSLPAWLFLGALIAIGRNYPEPVPRVAAPPWLSVRATLGLIVGLAVAVRLATALWLGDQVVSISGAADQVSYDALAQRLLDGHGFSFARGWYPFTAADAPTAHWSFLYTSFLAGVYAVAGHHPLVARLLQAALSGIGCWLVFRIGRRLCGERVGLAAAAAMALYAYFIFFAAALMTQTFYILALLFAVDRALQIVERPTTGAWAGLGLALGIGILLRQSMLLYVPPLLLWLIWRSAGRGRWRDPLLALALIAAAVLPWTARNHAAFNDVLLLNSNGGFFLWASNHPDQGHDFDPTLVPPLPPELRGRGEPELDRELTRRAIGFVIAEPGRFLDLTISRIGGYFSILPTRQSSSLSNAARLSSFTLYLPFMLAGLVLSLPWWRACMPLYLYVAVDTVLHLSSWAAPRYRLPSDALLMVFAGLALVRLADWFRRRT